MKRIKLILFSIIFSGCLLIFGNKTYAASASVSASSTTVTPGTSVTVSASVSATETYNLKMTTSGGNLTGNINNADAFGVEKSQGVLSGTFSSNTPGTYTITLSGTIAGSDFKIVNVSKSVSITVKQNNNDGNNNGGSTNNGSTNNGGNTNTGNGGTTDSAPTLSNLGIRPNDFSGFKPGKKEYSVTVPADCTSIEVYASSKNGTVSGTGTKTLKNGTNRFDVTVSNGSKKTTYTILVTKKSDEDGETPPNTIDDENPVEEPTQDGIGLASLEIEGYTLDKEFKTDVYEYTVKVNKMLTLEELESIKKKVKAVANAENVTVDIATNVSEDKVSTIVISVKDEEKEYAKYVVTFEVEKEDTKVAGIVKNNSNNSMIGMFGLTEEQQIYAILGGIGIITFLAIMFACVSYAKSRRIAKYENEEYEEDENSDFEKMNQYYIGMENTEAKDESVSDRTNEITGEPSIAETIEDTATRLRKANGYRRLARGRRSYGKH